LRRKSSVLQSVVQLLALTIVLFLCQAQALYRWFPDSLGLISQLLHSLSFWIILPGRLISSIFLPPIDHHYPIGNYILGCLLTGAFLTAALSGYSAWRQLKRRALKEGSRKSSNYQNNIALVMLTIGGMFFLYVSLVEPNRLVICEYTVEISDLPQEWDGLRIIQLSDTHYGPYINPGHLKRAVKTSNSLNPDLVLLTGDYTHTSPQSITPGIRLFGDLESTYGTIAILGNHDHWEGAAECQRAFMKTGIPLIDNNHLFLSHDDGIVLETTSESDLCIAGVGDYWEDECDLDSALKKVPDSMPRILLSHNPDFAEEIEPKHRVDLMLSGHTHGGQAYVPGFPRQAPTQYGEKYIGGYVEGPQCPVIVSRGLGMSVLPLRFLVPPEIVVITLRMK
jgi:uncharacterized protein